MGIQLHSNVPDFKALLDSRHRPITSGMSTAIFETEFYVSEVLRLVLQFKSRYLRNFAFRGLRENTLSVKGIRGNKKG